MKYLVEVALNRVICVTNAELQSKKWNSLLFLYNLPLEKVPVCHGEKTEASLATEVNGRTST